MDTPEVVLSPQNPVSNNVLAWSRKKKLVLLIASLLLPPLGVAIILWLLIKKLNGQTTRTWLSLFVATVIGAVGYGVLYVAVFQSKTVSYPYTYSNLTTSLLVGNGSSNGLLYKKPTEFTVVAPAGKANIANFAHGIHKNGIANSIGGQVVLSNPAPVGYRSIINQDFILPDSSSIYQSAVLPIKNFLKVEIPYLFFFADKNPKINLSISRPVRVPTANLVVAPWVFNYTATDTNLTSNKQKVSTIKGEVILTVGRINEYYVLLGAADYNWDSNSTTWKIILSSLKIDQ